MHGVLLQRQPLVATFIFSCFVFGFLFVAVFAPEDRGSSPHNRSLFRAREHTIEPADSTTEDVKEIPSTQLLRADVHIVTPTVNSATSTSALETTLDLSSFKIHLKGPEKIYVGTIHKFKKQNAMRRQKVKEMMKHAWTGYKNHAWGSNELRPISKTSHRAEAFGGEHMPATIIDSADTLFLMGLQVEYQQARDYIATSFSIANAGAINVFETNIRFLGGLLSLYALTNDYIYLTKAKEVGYALLPAFHGRPNGVPFSVYNLPLKSGMNYLWVQDNAFILAEVGSFHLEFTYLSRLTNDPAFEDAARNVRAHLDKIPKLHGLYPNFFSADLRPVEIFKVSISTFADSFYEYLLKSWLQTNKTDEDARRMYWDASKNVVKSLVHKSSSSNLTYVAQMENNTTIHKMDHMACFSVGMFALQAVNEDTEEQKREIMDLARELAKTCHESYIRTKTLLGPETFHFSHDEEATAVKQRENTGYVLRPEAIEGYFYLWRLTGDEMYRDWVWDVVQAIDKNCRIEHGFAGILNVNDPSQGFEDIQQSFFLAETLKYAYLTFADNSLINLDKWVFNTEAHPLPILVS